MDQIECNDVLNKYKNPKFICQGGQRIVYTAIHPEYGEVVLKIGNYKSVEYPNEWDIERIENEIHLQKQINSIYYPKNFSFEKISGSRYVINEEYIESEPLSKCMDRFQKPYEILDLIKHLVNGLNIIWSMKYVHLDVKPDNILINHKNIPVIIDLGIAMHIDKNSNSGLENPCSKDYTSPERLLNQRADIRTDQFSLGIILVQLLSAGVHPFDNNSGDINNIAVRICLNKWNGSAFEIENLKPILPLASRLLYKNPNYRYESTEELLEEISKLLDQYKKNLE
jgi:serine/threonine protein kinase